MNSENIQNETNKELLKQGKNKKKKTLVISIITIIIIIVLLLLFYAINSPKEIFKKFINTSFDVVNTNINEKTPRYISGTTAYNLNYNDKIVYASSVYNADTKKEHFNYNIISSYDNSPLLDLSIYKEKNTYIYLNGIYDKMIKLENTAGKKDINVIINSLNKAFINVINTEKINSKKEGNIKKLTLKVNKNIINELKKDKEFMKTINKFNITLKDIDAFDLSIYTKGFTNKVIGLQIKNNVDTLTIKKKSDKYTYEITGKDNINGVVTYKKENTNKSVKITFKGDLNGNLTISDTYSKTDKYNSSDIKNTIKLKDVPAEDIFGIYSKIIASDGAKKLLNEF